MSEGGGAGGGVADTAKSAMSTGQSEGAEEASEGQTLHLSPMFLYCLPYNSYISVQLALKKKSKTNQPLLIPIFANISVQVTF